MCFWKCVFAPPSFCQNHKKSSLKIIKIKTPASANDFAGTGDKFLRCHPAWYFKNTHSLRTVIRRLFFTESQNSVANTGRLAPSFLLPLEAHSVLRYSAALTPPAARLKITVKTYLLFFIGFCHCNTGTLLCQYVFLDFLKQFFGIF